MGDLPEDMTMSRNRNGTAMQRARRVWWSDVARQARTDMRRRGLMVGPWIDDVAGQRRGVSVADGLGRMADELRDAGLEDVAVRAVIVGAVERMLDGPQAA
jgi:hypothetical protein